MATQGFHNAIPRRLCMSITTWMNVPEFGMKGFEPLCRGSAFLLRAREWVGPRGPAIQKPLYHVVTCSHIVAPWRWPKLYTEDYLKHVNERHVHYTLEVREDGGTMANQTTLFPRVFHHPTRDMAVLHVDSENPAAKFKFLMNSGIETELSLATENSQYYPLTVGQDIAFHGHDVIAPFGEDAADMAKSANTEDFTDDSQFDRWVKPTVVAGKLQGRTEKQIFAVTAERTLPVGMCGGPVVVDRVFEPLELAPPKAGMTSDSVEAPWAASAAPIASAAAAAGTTDSATATTGARRRSAVSPERSRPATARAEYLIERRQQWVMDDDPRTENKRGLGKSAQVVVGMLEGIVPLDHPARDIQGSAVFIEAPDIDRFLRSVENNEVRPVVGGEAALRVGKHLAQKPEDAPEFKVPSIGGPKLKHFVIMSGRGKDILNAVQAGNKFALPDLLKLATNEDLRCHVQIQLLHINIVPYWMTALMLASHKGDTEMVNMLLEAGADADQQDAGHGYTALMFASMDGRIATAQALLEFGTAVNLQSTLTGETALMVAAGRGSVEIVRVLLDWGADKNLPNKSNRVATDMAKTDVIRALINNYDLEMVCAEFERRYVSFCEQVAEATNHGLCSQSDEALKAQFEAIQKEKTALEDVEFEQIALLGIAMHRTSRRAELVSAMANQCKRFVRISRFDLVLRLSRKLKALKALDLTGCASDPVWVPSSTPTVDGDGTGIDASRGPATGPAAVDPELVGKGPLPPPSTTSSAIPADASSVNTSLPITTKKG